MLLHRPRSIVCITRLDACDAGAAFVRLLHWLRPELPGETRSIVIKVNLCDYRAAETGAVTDPVTLEGLVDALRTAFGDCGITVIENDASAVEASSAIKILGIAAACDRKKVRWLNVAGAAWLTVKTDGTRVLRRVELPEVVASADLYVNFAKLKTNSYCKVTGVLKNSFGLLRPKRKSVYHRCLDDVLVDINRALPRGLYLVDGLVGMEGWGPAFGVPKHCGLLIGGIDPVAVDACCARIMGFNPYFVGHIRKCARAGIGSLRYRLITDIPGFRYRDYRFQYNRVEHLARSVLRRFFHFAG